MIKARLLFEDYRKEVVSTSNNDKAALALKNIDKVTHSKKEIICYKCGKVGHIKPKCLQIKKEKSQNQKRKLKINYS